MPCCTDLNPRGCLTVPLTDSCLTHPAVAGTDTPIFAGSAHSVPTCVCAPPAYPNPAAEDPSTAPYVASLGCLRRAVAESVQLRSSVVNLNLQKRTPHAGGAEVTTVELKIPMDGTDWLSDSTYWAIATPPPSWLHPISMMGNVTPPLSGSEVLITVPVNVSSTGISEFDSPHTHVMPFTIALAQVQTFPVTFTVAIRATPVASECVLTTANLPVMATVGVPATFTFSARDVDGLPLGYPVTGSPFAVATTHATTGAPAVGATGVVSHVTADEYRVSVTVTRLGTYQVSLELTADGITAALDFTVPLSVNQCQPEYVVLRDGRCGCPEGMFYSLAESVCRTCPAGLSAYAGSLECNGVPNSAIELAACPQPLCSVMPHVSCV